MRTVHTFCQIVREMICICLTQVDLSVNLGLCLHIIPNLQPWAYIQFQVLWEWRKQTTASFLFFAKLLPDQMATMLQNVSLFL